MRIVAVVGDHNETHDELAIPLGRWLARQAVHLLTGGGPGVMESVSRAFVEATPRPEGLTIGVLPTPKEGYPNRYVRIVIRTHLHGKRNSDGSGGNDPMGIYSRNRINALTADVVVALPGGEGTLSEMNLARAEKKPVVAFLRESDTIGGKSFSDLRTDFYVVDTIDQVAAFVSKYVS